LSLGLLTAQAQDQAGVYAGQDAAAVQQRDRAGSLIGSRVRSWDGRTGQSGIADNGTNLGLPGVRADSGNPSNPE